MAERICAVQDCGGRATGKGYCDQHYRAWTRYGDPLYQTNRGPKPKPRVLCSVEGCDETSRAGGLCGTHYYRDRHGIPLDAPIQVQMHGATASERFWARVDKSGECWLWLGSVNKQGYGTFAYDHPKRVGAHRFAYTDAVGPIPDDYEIDHLCWNRTCVRPEHLEAVTTEENFRRMKERHGWGEGW